MGGGFYGVAFRQSMTDGVSVLPGFILALGLHPILHPVPELVHCAQNLHLQSLGEMKMPHRSEKCGLELLM